MADIIAFPVDRIRPQVTLEKEAAQAILDDPVKFRRALQVAARAIAEDPTDDNIRRFAKLSAYFAKRHGRGQAERASVALS